MEPVPQRIRPAWPSPRRCRAWHFLNQAGWCLLAAGYGLAQQSARAPFAASSPSAPGHSADFPAGGDILGTSKLSPSGYDYIRLRKVNTSGWMWRIKNPHSGWCQSDDDCFKQDLKPFYGCSADDPKDGSQSHVVCWRSVSIDLCDWRCN